MQVNRRAYVENLTVSVESVGRTELVCDFCNAAKTNTHTDDVSKYCRINEENYKTLKHESATQEMKNRPRAYSVNET